MGLFTLLGEFKRIYGVGKMSKIDLICENPALVSILRQFQNTQDLGQAIEDILDIVNFQVEQARRES